MSTKDLMKWGAIGLAAWWLIAELNKPNGMFSKWLPEGGAGTTGGAGAGTGAAAGAGNKQLPAGTGGSGATGGETGTGTGTGTGSPASLPQAAQAMVAAAGRASGLSWDEWNYYYNRVTGNQGPAPESMGIARTLPMPKMSIARWMSLVGGKVDLSGLVGMGGLYRALQGGWS